MQIAAGRRCEREGAGGVIGVPGGGLSDEKQLLGGVREGAGGSGLRCEAVKAAMWEVWKVGAQIGL